MSKKIDLSTYQLLILYESLTGTKNSQENYMRKVVETEKLKARVNV